MKILLIIPTLAAGGAERILSQLAEQWSNEGHEVSFLLLGGGEPFYALPPTVKIHDLSYPSWKRISKVLSLPLTFLTLRRIVKSERPDVVLSFLERFNIFSLFATKGLGTPVTVADRNDPTRKLSPMLAKAKRISYAWSHGVVVQTQKAGNILSEMLPLGHNVAVIPNFVRKIRPYPDIQRKKIILNVGRLTQQKGQCDLIEAFAALPDKDWVLRILGDGTLRDELEAQAHRLGVKDRVELLGAVENVDEHLASASIFAFSSHFEGFPNALCEAMASGVSCISTDCNTGPSEIIEDGINGFLVPVGDIVEMTRQLGGLQEDERLRRDIGREAAKIVKVLDRENISQRWLDVMTSCNEKSL